MRKILFLDFDGVLNNVPFDLHKKAFPGMYSSSKDRLKNATSRHINPYCVEVLKFILSECKDLRIVVSSSWRKHFNLSELQWILKKHGVPADKIIGKTGVPGPGKFEGTGSQDVQRGDLCLQWATENLIDRENFVCLDDDNDFDAVRDRFVRTCYLDGLTMLKGLEVLKLLGIQNELSGLLQEEPRTEP